MENSSKYYTPEIEEFHVEFEFEQNYDLVLTIEERVQQESTWYPKIFEVKDFEFIEHLIKTEFVRVKHLDKEDIESLGWKLIKTGNGFSSKALIFVYTKEIGFNTGTTYTLTYYTNNPSNIEMYYETYSSYNNDKGKLIIAIKL